MQKNKLINYLQGTISSSMFFGELAEEVSVYKSGLSKKGASVPVLFSGKESFTVNIEHIVRLYLAYRSNKVCLSALVYIADAIAMDNDWGFNNETTENFIYVLSELDISEELSQNELNELDVLLFGSSLSQK